MCKVRQSQMSHNTKLKLCLYCYSIAKQCGTQWLVQFLQIFYVATDILSCMPLNWFLEVKGKISSHILNFIPSAYPVCMRHIIKYSCQWSPAGGCTRPHSSYCVLKSHKFRFGISRLGKVKRHIALLNSAWLCQQSSWNQNLSLVRPSSVVRPPSVRLPWCNYLWMRWSDFLKIALMVVLGYTPRHCL